MFGRIASVLIHSFFWTALPERDGEPPETPIDQLNPEGILLSPYRDWAFLALGSITTIHYLIIIRLLFYSTPSITRSP